MMYLSFLLRLWREPILEPPGLPPDWQVELEHIQSGQQWAFDSLEEFLEFMREQVEPLAHGTCDRVAPAAAEDGSDI